MTAVETLADTVQQAYERLILEAEQAKDGKPLDRQDCKTLASLLRQKADYLDVLSMERA